MSHRYELTLSLPPYFEASGLDAAHRVAARVTATVRELLEEDPEVEAVERPPIFREKTPDCTKAAACPANLHYDGCPKRH